MSSMPVLTAAQRPELALRALVVEDDSDIAHFVCLGLRSEGFDVHVCSDGAAVLRAAEQTHPDVVVLDWLLPRIDGLEVCKRLRALGDPAIIMLTTRGRLNDSRGRP